MSGVALRFEELQGVDRIWHLRQAVLLKGLSVPDLAAIAQICSDHIYSKGEVIFSQDDVADAVKIPGAPGNRTGRLDADLPGRPMGRPDQGQQSIDLSTQARHVRPPGIVVGRQQVVVPALPALGVVAVAPIADRLGAERDGVVQSTTQIARAPDTVELRESGR